MSNLFRAKNLKAALLLADVGFPVFPARAIYNPITGRWNKPPYIAEWQSRATTDLRKVTSWWRQYPDAIPAISCDEFAVVDADQHIGGADGVAALDELASQYGDWPDHPVLNTPSGGEHHYFAQSNPTVGNRTGHLPAGIDVRGIGGFVIGPGAVLPNGMEWRLAPDFSTSLPPLPEWLEGLVRANKTHPVALDQQSTAAVGRREERYAESALEIGIADVELASRGRRNTVLNSVAYRIGRMVGAGWIDRGKVEFNLLIAGRGLAKDDGTTAVIRTIKSGLDAGCKKPHPDLQDRKKGNSK